MATITVTLIVITAFVLFAFAMFMASQKGFHLVWTQNDDGSYSHNPAQISSKDGFSNPQNGDPGF